MTSPLEQCRDALRNFIEGCSTGIDAGAVGRAALAAAEAALAAQTGLTPINDLVQMPDGTVMHKDDAATLSSQVAPESAYDYCGRLQRRCCEWGVYWRASDAHGVNLSHEQALELLCDVLGVEVEIAAAIPRYIDSTPHLSVGNSAFEHWFQAQPFATQVGIKQISRDSYAAGMGDPLVVAAPVAAPVAQPQPIPKERLALNVQHKDCHKAADAFWTYWNENGETHKRGYYESTWGAINRALRTVGVVEHDYPAAPKEPA